MVNQLTLTFSETGYVVDLSDQQIKVVKQVADIGDITKQMTTYSWVFKFPRTPENTAALHGLGLPGDVSTFPYKRVDCFLTYNGVVIEANGRFMIKSTPDQDYKAYVQAGIIDFYMDIQDDQISEILDLSDLDHENTITNITNSFTQDTYRYIIASYNGPPLEDVGGVTNFSPYALVPSINVGYLWDAILAYYGWTDQLPASVDLSDRWLTYPNAQVFDDNSPVPVADYEQTTQLVLLYEYEATGAYYELPFATTSVDSAWVQVLPASAPTVGTRMEIQQPGILRFTLQVSGSVLYIDRYTGAQLTRGIDKISIWHNGTKVGEQQSGDVVVDRIVQTGDVIEAKVFNDDFLEYIPYQLTIDSAYFTADLIGVQDISFSRALIKVKVKDFFKDVMVRFSLVVFPDVETKKLTFLTLQDRLEADVVDWSSKYVRRINERYQVDGMAQSNYLRHKYNKESEDHADGNIQVDNHNLAPARDLYKSFTYAQELSLALITTSEGDLYVPIFKMFDIEVEEEPGSSGQILLNYEPLKDRFYMIQDQAGPGSIYILGNEVTDWPVAVVNGNTFNDIVDLWYSHAPQLYNEARVHDIELELSEYDLAQLDLEKLYYFEQEGNYYLLQNIKFEPGEISTGEFIRVDYFLPQSSLTS